MQNSRISRLNYLQSLRAVAALLVCFGHVIHEMSVVSHFEWVGYLKAIPTSIGVDIFFLISGFIMMRTSYHSFGEVGAGRRFLVRRIVRVVPIYWMYTSLIVLVALVAPNLLDTARLDVSHVLMSYLFIPHFDPNRLGSISPILAVGWTLNYEMFFYVVFAAGLMFFRKLGIAMIVGIFVIAYMVAMLGNIGGAAAVFFSNTIIFEFLCGIGLYYILSLNLDRRWIVWFFMALSLLLWVASYYLSLWEYRFFKFGLPAVALFLIFHEAYDSNWRLARLFELLGDASYGMYLAHPFVLTFVKVILFKIFPVSNGSLASYFLISMVGISLFSIAFYKLIEQPSTKFLMIKLGPALLPSTKTRATN